MNLKTPRGPENLPVIIASRVGLMVTAATSRRLRSRGDMTSSTWLLCKGGEKGRPPRDFIEQAGKPFKPFRRRLGWTPSEGGAT